MLKTNPVLMRRAALSCVLLSAALFLCLPCLSRADALRPDNCAENASELKGTESRLKLSDETLLQEIPTAEEKASEVPCQYRGYAMLCLANAYPGLKSEALIGNLFDPLMGVIAPGIDRVHTFSDMRDNGLLWVPNVGGGYNISQHLSLFLQVGYGAGPVRTKDSATSLLVLPLDLYFKMRRSAVTITPGLDYFPFGMVEQRDYHGLMDRLRAIRPTLGVRVPWTHAGYKARINLGLGRADELLKVRLGNTWDLWSANVNVGFDVPITRRNQVNVNLGRSFFFGHDSDFGGVVFSVTWKYLF